MSSRTPRPIPPYPGLTIESEQRVWSGRFPLDVVRFRHRRFDGAESGTRTWELWRRGRASAVLPWDPVKDVVVLIEQFRFPALAAGLDPVMVELPAGLCEDNEPADVTAHREMQEEMGMAADLLERVGDFILTAGGSDETCAVYVGRVSAPEAGPDGIVGHGGEAAEHEDIRARAWRTDAAIEAALAGRFANSITAIGLLWLAHRRDWLREKWKIA